MALRPRDTAKAPSAPARSTTGSSNGQGRSRAAAAKPRADATSRTRAAAAAKPSVTASAGRAKSPARATTARAAAKSPARATTARAAAKAPARAAAARAATKAPARSTAARSATKTSARTTTARAAAKAPTRTGTARAAAKAPARTTTARAAAKPPTRTGAARAAAKAPARAATAAKSTRGGGGTTTTSRAPSRQKWVYLFEDGDASMRDLLGGKGAGVSEMTRAGLPVPPGFTITTAACNAFYDAGRSFPEGMWTQTLRALHHIEQRTGKRFGDARNPLLVSVRSGAKFSMPGMMDTVLNLGLSQATLEGVATLTGDRRFALDAYRRFIQLFGKIVLGVDGEYFEAAIEAAKQRAKVSIDADLTPEHLEQLIVAYKEIVRKHGNAPFPDEPVEQLRAAIGAVFSSWNNKRATDYRNFNKISHSLGTAVNVQSMVFGNMGADSGTGVAFTRDPNTGEKVLFGEYLLNAQGEDVVAGIRTPEPIARLQQDMPKVYRQFEQIAKRLEKHYRDIQDMEFTIERGTLYMLQTRTGKRTAQATVKIAVDMVRERLITKQEAVQRVEPAHIDQLLHTRIDPAAKVRVLARGLAASPGAAFGKAVFDADRAETMSKHGEHVILVRIETNPDDVHGMIASQGVLTARGGRTSHAAVVARGMGKPCVAAAESLRIDLDRRLFTAPDGTVIKEGDEFTIDGSSGNVIAGSVPMIQPEISGELEEVLRWADSMRRMGVWANADYPRDAEKALELGAEGVGLCRTEHMFMEQSRLPVVQRMILAENEADRRKELDKLLPMQQGDFYGILKAMAGKTVVIRLIDPPLHEFLPSLEELLVRVTEAKTRGDKPKKYAADERMLAAVRRLHEQNPMLGMRGCRLGLMFPEIIEMQVRGILQATVALKREGVDVRPEIMIPLVGHVNELTATLAYVKATAAEVLKGTRGVKYKFGTMIEIPRGALTAGAIAEHAEFFSFGTNDLTQTCFGYSRDDAEGKFLLRYIEEKILPENPFESIDRTGVGRLMDIAVREGRAARPGLVIGICGEHGGDPSSIAFCEQLGLDYVSCSPYRVPVARLAAAHAVLAKVDRDR